MAVGDAYVFPGFLTPVLTHLFFPKPPTTFLTCYCRGEPQPGMELTTTRSRVWHAHRPGEMMTMVGHGHQGFWRSTMFFHDQPSITMKINGPEHGWPWSSMVEKNVIFTTMVGHGPTWSTMVVHGRKECHFYCCGWPWSNRVLNTADHGCPW